MSGETRQDRCCDAEAIAEAVTRPTMPFVAVKTTDQQAVLMLHKVHKRLVRQRTHADQCPTRTSRGVRHCSGLRAWWSEGSDRGAARGAEWPTGVGQGGVARPG